MLCSAATLERHLNVVWWKQWLVVLQPIALRTALEPNAVVAAIPHARHALPLPTHVHATVAILIKLGAALDHVHAATEGKLGILMSNEECS